MSCLDNILQSGSIHLVDIKGKVCHTADEPTGISSQQESVSSAATQRLAADSSTDVSSGELHTFRSLHQGVVLPSCLHHGASLEPRQQGRSSSGSGGAAKDKRVASRPGSSSGQHESSTTADLVSPARRTPTSEYAYPEAASFVGSSSGDATLIRLCSCRLVCLGGPPAGSCPHMPIAVGSLDPNDPSLTPAPPTEPFSLPYTPLSRFKGAATKVIQQLPPNASAARRAPRSQDAAPQGSRASATGSHSADSSRSARIPSAGEGVSFTRSAPSAASSEQPFTRTSRLLAKDASTAPQGSVTPLVCTQPTVRPCPLFPACSLASHSHRRHSHGHHSHRHRVVLPLGSCATTLAVLCFIRLAHMSPSPCGHVPSWLDSSWLLAPMEVAARLRCGRASACRDRSAPVRLRGSGPPAGASSLAWYAEAALLLSSAEPVPQGPARCNPPVPPVPLAQWRCSFWLSPAPPGDTLLDVQ